MSHFAPPPPPSWRKPVGALAIVAIPLLWAMLIAGFAETLNRWPIWGQTLVYLAAGIAWILPLRPLLIWMETGKWRE